MAGAVSKGHGERCAEHSKSEHPKADVFASSLLLPRFSGGITPTNAHLVRSHFARIRDDLMYFPSLLKSDLSSLCPQTLPDLIFLSEISLPKLLKAGLKSQLRGQVSRISWFHWIPLRRKWKLWVTPLVCQHSAEGGSKEILQCSAHQWKAHPSWGTSGPLAEAAIRSGEK